ncbi:sensor histidine kinase [Paenibacillus brevis]|uniref:Sensor histidine kinase n=1 Tax=Paenibacillus brevis TaxID=2841508 RepID=A0ABS6FMG0_9BACL|nr:sensor histidine kinase [Paenibacillus brevis]MBU5671179.1 sensor histidine kinase [Paenibacillus brevis]
MRRFFGRSLKHKLSLMVMVSTVLPLLCFGFFSYYIATEISEDKAKQAGMNTLRQIRTQLEFMTKDIENMSIFLIGDNDIQDYLGGTRSDSLLQSSIYGFLMNLAYTKEYIANIEIRSYNEKPTIAQTTVFSSGYPIQTSKSSPMEGKVWTSLYEDITATGTKRVISLMRPIQQIGTYQYIGEMTISLDEKVVAGLLRKSDLEGNGYILLLDRDQKIISSTDSANLQLPIASVLPDFPSRMAEEGAFNSGGKDNTVLYYKVPSMDWTLVGVIPFKEYSAQNRYVLSLTGFAVMIAIVLSFVFLLLLISRVTKPLSSLVKYLNLANPEKPIPLLPVVTMDEVGQLMRSYNRLTERIRNLTDQVKHNEALKKEADLLALQAQINPHFLYNTLSSINWLALLNKEYQIAKMVGSLSEFLRFSLNGGGEFCTVRQEIEHAQSYVNIQSIRYPACFDFQIRVDPVLMDQPMLKLLLQPLIENAILHGVLKKEGKGNIGVQVEKSEMGTCFTVSDDGAGIEKSKLAELSELISEADEEREIVLKQGSYGLRNVHQRLILHYGPGYGLKLDSDLSRGTKVSFVIPDQKEEQQ